MFSEARRIANTREHFSCILTWLRATKWPTHDFSIESLATYLGFARPDKDPSGSTTFNRRPSCQAAHSVGIVGVMELDVVAKQLAANWMVRDFYNVATSAQMT